jgi:hypothetical protein
MYINWLLKHQLKFFIAETQVWLDYSLACGYISEIVHQKLFNDYDNIIGKIVNMINHTEKWSI